MRRPCSITTTSIQVNRTVKSRCPAQARPPGGQRANSGASHTGMVADRERVSGRPAGTISTEMDSQTTSRGDDFERILRETQGLIRAHIAGMGVRSDEVDDVAQEVYLDYAKNPERRPPDVEVLRWLRGMARNCCHEYFRRRARQAKHLVAISETLCAEAPPPASDDELGEAKLTALRNCMERLGQPHRELLNRYYQDGQSAEELANAQGRSVGAVHMVLSRLRETLRRCLLGQLGTVR